MTGGPLSTDEIERFVANGHVLLDGAFSSDTAERCRDWLWSESGVDRDDASTWTEPVVRIGGSQEPQFIEVMNTPRLHGAIDQLVGVGRWDRPIHGTGTFPIRFPSDRDPGDAGWHVDGSFYVDGELYVDLHTRGRQLLMLVLFSDVGENDAPTRIRRGSHLLVPPVLVDAGDAGLHFGAVVPRVTGLADLPIDFATGRAGDIFLCHPFLVHAATWPHAGTTPRFIAQPGLAPTEPVLLDRADEDSSPVERAIRAGLARR